ncbi:PRD domain-containing protein [Clostridium perfringens]|nr:PRD domain-containing protein [Clostridium perfringens]
MREKYPLSYKIAEETRKIICRVLDISSVSEDDVAYLAMHIDRFRVSIIK